LIPNISPQSAYRSTVTTTDENPPPPRPSPRVPGTLWVWCGGGKVGGIFVAEAAKTATLNQTSPNPRHMTVRNLRDSLLDFGSPDLETSGGFSAHQRRGRWYRRPLRSNRGAWVDNRLSEIGPGAATPEIGGGARERRRQSRRRHPSGWKRSAWAGPSPGPSRTPSSGPRAPPPVPGA